MGEATDDVPKAFLDVDGRTLYDRQRTALAGRVDDVTVVAGYSHETVLDRLSSANAVVLEDWDEYDNAESLRRALDGIDDDVLVLNGDVVVAPSVIDRLRRRFEAEDRSVNLVGCIPGLQDDHTAIRCDDDGSVVEYGMVPGHRHAGVGVLSRRHLDAATDVLARNCGEWYPLVYPETPTERLVVPPENHVELNRPEDLDRARKRFPLTPNRELDARR